MTPWTLTSSGGAALHDMRAGEALYYGFHFHSFGSISWSMPMASVSMALIHQLPHGWLLFPAYLLICAIFFSLIFALGKSVHSCLLGFVCAGTLFRQAFIGGMFVYAFLILLVANILIWRSRNPTPFNSAVLGVAIGLSLLVRSPMFLFPILLVAYDIFARKERSVKNLLLVFVVPYLFLLPWIYMNWKIHGRFIPFEFHQADTNIISGALGFVQTMEGDSLKLAGIGRGESALIWAIGEVFRHPLRYLWAYALRVIWVFRLHPIIFSFGFAAALIHRNKEDFRQLGILAAYFILIYCTMPVQDYYFAPIWPILFVLSIGGAAQIIRPVKNKNLGKSWAIPVGFCFIVFLLLGCFSSILVAAYPSRLAEQIPLEQVLRHHSGDPVLWRELGYRQLMAHHPDEAVKSFGKALQLELSPDAELDYAWALLVRDKSGRDLIERLQFRTAMSGTRVRARLLRVIDRLQLGDEKGARNDLSRAESLWFHSDVRARGSTPWEKTMESRLRSKDDRLTVVDMRDLLSSWPFEKQVHLVDALSKIMPIPESMMREIARTALKGVDIQTAIMMARMAKWPATLTNDIAWAALKKGDIQTAIMIARMAKWPATLANNIAWAALKKGDSQAVSRMIAALKKSRSPESDHDRALLYQQMGDYFHSLKILDRLILKNPSNSEYWSDRGVVFFMIRKPLPAMADFEKAISLNPSQFPAYLSLSSLYASSGRLNEAIVLDQKALRQPVSKGEEKIWALIAEDLAGLKRRAKR